MAARPRRPGDPRADADADATRAATSCARPAIRPSSCADLDAAFDRLDRAPPQRRVPRRPRRPRSWPARTSPPPARSSPRTAPRALDLLGFASQLVFNTFHNRRLRDWEHGGDLELADRRRPGPQPGDGRVLLASTPGCCRRCYVPLADLDRAGGAGRPRRSRWAPPRCSSRRAARPTTPPATSALDPVWAAASEAGIPIVFHVGGTGDLIDPNYFRNGLPIPPDFHGGEENFRSVDYMGIPGAAGADAGDDDLRRRVRALPRPARRRHRAGRDLGAVVDAPDGVGVRRLRPARGAAAARCRCGRASTCAARSASRRTPPRTSAGSSSRPGPEVCLFSSDYPHVEGGRRPIERFEASLGRASTSRPARPSTTTTSST